MTTPRIYLKLTKIKFLKKCILKGKISSKFSSQRKREKHFHFSLPNDRHDGTPNVSGSCGWLCIPLNIQQEFHEHSQSYICQIATY
jgi:hypothetical protein